MPVEILAKNAVQKSPVQAINDQSSVIDSVGVTIYTCPAGKIASGTLHGFLNSYGSNTAVRFRAAGSKICNWQSGTDPVRSAKSATFALAAGEVLNVTASGAGADSEADWAAVITESPA